LRTLQSDVGGEWGNGVEYPTTAKRFGLKVIDTYGSIIDRILRANAEVTASHVLKHFE
jgi:hypothetical protein